MNNLIVYHIYKKINLYINISTFIIIFIILYAFPSITYSETSPNFNLVYSSSSISKDGNHIINATIDKYYSKDIIKALKEGFNSEIIFNIRISKKRKELETILRNSIATEYFEKRLVKYNPYKNNFSVDLEKLYVYRFDNISNNQLPILRKETVEYSEKLVLTTEEELISFLFHLKNLILKTNLPATIKENLLIKADITIIKLPPPLHLISLFKDGIKIESNWQLIPNDHYQ